jgi:hypothetical protein
MAAPAYFVQQEDTHAVYPNDHERHPGGSDAGVGTLAGVGAIGFARSPSELGRGRPTGAKSDAGAVGSRLETSRLGQKAHPARGLRASRGVVRVARGKMLRQPRVLGNQEQFLLRAMTGEPHPGVALYPAA